MLAEPEQVLRLFDSHQYDGTTGVVFHLLLALPMCWELSAKHWIVEGFEGLGSALSAVVAIEKARVCEYA